MHNGQLFMRRWNGVRFQYKDILQEHSPSRRKPKQHSYKSKSFSNDQALASLKELDGCLSVPILYRKFSDLPTSYALVASTSKGFDDVVESLIGYQDSALWLNHPLEGSVLKAASENGHAKIVEILINSKLDMIPYTSVAIDAAAKHGYRTIVDILLEYTSNSEFPSSQMQRLRQDEKFGYDSVCLYAWSLIFSSAYLLVKGMSFVFLELTTEADFSRLRSRQRR